MKIDMSLKKFRTRDEFEYWLFDMDDALVSFLNSLPEDLRQRLDFTPASLGALENWLLQRYPDVNAALDRYEYQRIDDISRYIGETFRRNIGGKWDIRLDNPRFVLYGLPVLTGYGDPPTRESISPLTLATTALDRRSGTYLQMVLNNKGEGRGSEA